LQCVVLCSRCVFEHLLLRAVLRVRTLYIYTHRDIYIHTHTRCAYEHSKYTYIIACNIATHCNTLQHTATHCNTLQRTATHCNTLQRTATHCNTLPTYVICTYRIHYCVHEHPMVWLRLVGSNNLQISFAEYSLFYRALLQKWPII